MKFTAKRYHRSYDDLCSWSRKDRVLNHMSHDSIELLLFCNDPAESHEPTTAPQENLLLVSLLYFQFYSHHNEAMTMESTGLNTSYYNLDSMLQGHVQIRSQDICL